MPTSLTQPIFDNPGFTFEQFAWLCTRAMIPAILLRDSEFRVPTEEDITSAVCASEVEHCEVRVRQSASELADMTARSAASWETENVAVHERRLREHEASLQRYTEQRGRFVRMLERVTAWQPPTPEHDGLKRLMIEQCQYETDQSPPSAPSAFTAEQYREDTLEYARRQVEWRTEDLRKARERVAFKDAWFKALRESVPLPEIAAEVKL